MTAPRGSDPNTIIKIAERETGIEPKHWKVKMEQGMCENRIKCTSRTPLEGRASIHFGNYDLAGRINPGYTDHALTEEAQNQLGMIGQWHVRSSTRKGALKVLEAEQEEILEDHQVMPEDAIVTVDFEVTRNNVAVKAEDDEEKQAERVQGMWK
jgi:hypothetical protein